MSDITQTEINHFVSHLINSTVEHLDEIDVILTAPTDGSWSIGDVDRAIKSLDTAHVDIQIRFKEH